MPKLTRRYFVCGNTGTGFVSFFPQSLERAERVYLLKGGPGTGKSTLMKKMSRKGLEQGWQVDEIVCSSDPSSLDGVLLDGGRIVIADATAPHVLEPSAPGAVEDYVNLGLAWDHSLLKPHKETIHKTNCAIARWYKAVYAHLATARVFYEERETLWERLMDSDMIDSTTEALIEECLGKTAPTEKTGRAQHRFLNALGGEKTVSLAEPLSESMPKRYFIQSPSRRSCSEILGCLAKEAAAKGLSVEIYHSYFDSNEIAMVQLPSLGICAFDSMADDGVYPCREEDVILDLSCAAKDTDSKTKERILALTAALEEKLAEARQCLKKAQALHLDLEKLYYAAMDFSVTETICQSLLQDTFGGVE